MWKFILSLPCSLYSYLKIVAICHVFVHIAHWWPSKFQNKELCCSKSWTFDFPVINPLNAELNPIWHLLALLGAQHILHVSRVRVKLCWSFNIYGSMYHNNILIQKSQQDARVTEFILYDDCSTCFGYHYHPSSGTQNNCNYIIWKPLHRIVVCCYRGRVGTDLSVWVAYHPRTHKPDTPKPAT